MEVCKVELPDGSPEILVVLLGWYLAKDRHVQKIAQAYTTQGHIACLYAVAPPGAVADIPPFSWNKRHEFAQSVIKDIIKFLEHETPKNGIPSIIFHCFSNGGFLPTREVLRILSTGSSETKAVASRIAGLVHDSCPAFLDPKASKGALRVKEGTVTSKILDFVARLPFERLSDMVFYRWINFQPFPAAPQLFLYSTGDAITRADKVEEYSAQLKNMGIDVQVVNFGATPHVEHFREREEEYMDLVFKFVEHCRNVAATQIKCELGTPVID